MAGMVSFPPLFPLHYTAGYLVAVVLEDSFIIVALICDKIVRERIHPVLLYAGLVIITEIVFEVITFDTIPSIHQNFKIRK